MTAKRYFLSIIALCSFLAGAHAQYNPWWQWAKADTPSALTYSGAGSVLGVKNGRALWGRITANHTVVHSTVMGTWTLTEYDSTGKVTAAAAFGGKVEMIDVQADAAGNWYVLGRFHDSLVLPSQVKVRPNPDNNPDADYFMLKLNAGSFFMSWFKPIGSQRGVSSRAFTIDNSRILIAVDSSDATYVRSMSFTTGDYLPVLKQTGASTTTSIQTDASGNIYMAGSCANKGNIDFNGVLQTAAPGSTNAYIVRYNAAGAHIWHQWMNDPRCAKRKLSLFKDRFLYYTGTLHDSITIGTISLHPPLRLMDFMYARLDINGNVLWAHQIDTSANGEAYAGEAAFHAAVTPDTALVVFAQANAYLDWGNNVKSQLFGTYAAVPVAFGSDGVARWERPILGDNTTNDHVVAEGDAVWVSGNAYTSTAVTRFDTLNLKMPARKWVPFMGRLRLTTPPPVGVNTVKGSSLSAYPNPAHNAIHIVGLTGTSNLSLRDITGRLVLEKQSNNSEVLLDVSTLPRGTYFLQLVRSGSAPQVQKMVLQ
jgi:hypothetical protein